MMNIPRMRTVCEITAELKELDPCTALTACAIRRLVKEGTIRSIKVGKKHLINLDQLINHLNSPLQEIVQEEDVPENVTHIQTDRMSEYRKNIGMLK
ncbi:hypothetical protein [Acetobacterium bakii]|uniref:hypothetical protein n=1 Tax=Acetobacterium bakii TaxID=52689 RepID=UPI0006820C4B|nr:hypothetical protein [Acetobacterium bakii]